MIENADELGGSRARETALACVEAGIEAAHPRRVIRDSVAIEDGALRVGEASYDLERYDEIVVVGGGKAAGTVAAALEEVLGEHLVGGVVVTNDPVGTDRIEVVEGDHPVPSERGVAGARRVLDRTREVGERTLVLAVITGGGSALLPAPAEGIGLDDLQGVTSALLESGANIHEINAVRKHASAIKGGGLARAAAPADVVGIVLSDVVGDDLDVIASGPTAPDPSTFREAIDVLDRYDIRSPGAIRERLERGAAGEVPETPDATDPVFGAVENHVLANGFTAIEAARETACDRGYASSVISSRLRGEARELGRVHAAVAEEAAATGNPVEPPAVVLTGGEATVTVRGDGDGGPNQELALAAAIELADFGERAALASVDTDGEDGATDAAGALIDSATVEDADAARNALAENDAYPHLADREALVFTGPTGTNVNDLRVLVIE